VPLLWCATGGAAGLDISNLAVFGPSIDHPRVGIEPLIGVDPT
jgi:hypothetical protein